MQWNEQLAKEMPDQQHEELLQALKTVEVWCKAQGFTPTETDDEF
jgi:hypothetical protein